MFGRRPSGVSAADMKAMGEIAASMMEITAEAAKLKGENKALREDRDTWKELALKLSGQVPATTSGSEK